MSQFGWVTKVHVLAAIRDYRKDGGEESLARYGLVADDADVMVIERGRQYDARAVLLAAHEKAVGEAVAADELPADLVGLLEGLELKATSLRAVAEAAAHAEDVRANRNRVPGAARVKKTATSAPVAVAEPVAAVCPTCMMQLPAGSKVCYYCG